jgi:hypothetical protein
MDYARRAKVPQEVHRARQGSGLGKEFAEELPVAPLEDPGLLWGDIASELPGGGAGEQPAAHPDPAVDLPPVYAHTRLGEGSLPSEDVGVDGVYQRPVEVEDQGAHRPSQVPIRPVSGGLFLGPRRGEATSIAIMSSTTATYMR